MCKSACGKNRIITPLIVNRQSRAKEKHRHRSFRAISFSPFLFALSFAPPELNILSAPGMLILHALLLLFFLYALAPLSTALPTLAPELIPRQIPFCPIYSRPMLRPDGEPRKCLPHQLNLCLNALEDSALIDTSGICCYHNQVDYFCCMDIPARLCPAYQNVTVVIHNNFPHSPFPVRTFHFRKGVEQQIADEIIAASAAGGK